MRITNISPHRRGFVLAVSLFLAVILLCALSSHAQKQSSDYSRWVNLPSEQLMEMGDGYDRMSNADSAIVCYTIVANRYDPGMSRDEKLTSMNAYTKLWSAYFLAYLDYAKSYEYLSRAQEIAREIGVVNPRINLSLGGMYATIALICDDTEMNRKAFDFFRKAFWQAVETGDTEKMNIAYSNLLSWAFENDIKEDISAEREAYIKNIPPDAQDEYASYNNLMYEGMQLERQGRFEESRERFRRQISEMPFDSRHVRFLAQSYFNIADSYAKENDFDRALKSVNAVKAMTDSFKIYDVKVEVLDRIARYYKAMGLHDEALKAENQYLVIKDSVLNYQQIKNMSNLEFLSEINDIEAQIKEERQKKKELNQIIVGIAIFALLVIVFLIFIVVKNKKLKKRNESLFRKTQELMTVEAECQRLRKIAETAAPPSQAEPHPQERADRYVGSSLSEEAKMRLKDQIASVMEESREVYSPGFTIENLAGLVNARVKQVSQVINEIYGFNFNILLNNYRIKEALRLMNEAGADQRFSVEGISSDVGFKSRTSFSTAFKRVTGLSPSDYIKLKKNQQ